MYDCDGGEMKRCGGVEGTDLAASMTALVSNNHPTRFWMDTVAQNR